VESGESGDRPERSIEGWCERDPCASSALPAFTHSGGGHANKGRVGIVEGRIITDLNK
jgi:hypothetical protein